MRPVADQLNAGSNPVVILCWVGGTVNATAWKVVPMGLAGSNPVPSVCRLGRVRLIVPVLKTGVSLRRPEVQIL